MTDDPVRDAFLLLDRERPTPSPEFSEALFKRVLEDRQAPTVRRMLRPVRRPFLSPGVRRALVALAALAVSALIIAPLLPLARDKEQPAEPTVGDVIWIREFSGQGDVMFFDVAASGSEVYASAVIGPDSYGIPWNLYRYDGDGRRLWTTGQIIGDQRAMPIAADPSGGVYIGYAQGLLGPIRKYGADGTYLSLESQRFGRLQDRVEALAVGEGAVFVAGDRTPALVGAMDPGGSKRWIAALPASDEVRGITVDQEGVFSIGTSMDGSPTLWMLDGAGRVSWAQTLDGGTARAVAAAGGSVFVVQHGPDGASISAFDGITGAGIWTRNLGPGTSADDVVADGSGVYVAGTTNSSGDLGGFIRAFRADGAAWWSSDVLTSGTRHLSLALAEDGLYVSGVVDGASGVDADRDGFLAKVGAGA